MHIETALMTYLLAQSGITDLVGEAIYFVQTPQETQGPYIVFSKISSPRTSTHDGPDGMTDARFQFSCFAATYGGAKEVAVALQGAIHGYQGMMGGESGVYVESCGYDDETDLDHGEYGLFGVAADYILAVKE